MSSTEKKYIVLADNSERHSVLESGRPDAQQPVPDISTSETIADRLDLAGETRKDLHIGTFKKAITLTKDNFDSTLAELTELRDQLKSGDISDKVACQISVKSDSLSLALGASSIVRDIHSELKKHPNSSAVLSHPLTLRVKEDDSLQAIDELNSILVALQDPRTPKSIKPQIVIKTDSEEAVSEIAKYLFLIKKELQNYPEGSLTLKATAGTSKEIQEKMLQNYKIEAAYQKGEYSVSSKNLEEDMKNLALLLERAYQDPDKIIKVHLPHNPSFSHQYMDHLRECANFFEKKYAGSFTLVVPSIKSAINPYRGYFIVSDNKLELGKYHLDKAQELETISKLNKIADDLRKKAENPHQSSHAQWHLHVYKDVKLPEKILRKIDDIRELDYSLQKEYVSYRNDNFLFSTNKFWLPGKRYLDFKKNLHDGYELAKEAGKETVSTAAGLALAGLRKARSAFSFIFSRDLRG